MNTARTKLFAQHICTLLYSTCLFKSVNAHPSQVLLREVVVHLGAGSSCGADRKHAGFLELEQLERENSQFPHVKRLNC